MKLREFIRQNREQIDRVIREHCQNVGRINDEERRLWVLNCEPLYWWAKANVRGI